MPTNAPHREALHRIGVVRDVMVGMRAVRGIAAMRPIGNLLSDVPRGEIEIRSLAGPK